jgi:hypothetical protein
MITTSNQILEVRMSDRSPKPAAGMSRWVKVTLIALAVVALLVVVLVAVNSGGIGGHQIPQHASTSDSVVNVSIHGPSSWM